jgi:hypothetical protein
MDQIIIVVTVLTLGGQVVGATAAPFKASRATLEDCMALAEKQERAANAMAQARNRHYRVRHVCKKQ